MRQLEAKLGTLSRQLAECEAHRRCVTQELHRTCTASLGPSHVAPLLHDESVMLQFCDALL